MKVDVEGWRAIKKMPSRFEENFETYAPLGKERAYRYVEWQTRRDYESAYENLGRWKHLRTTAVAVTAVMALESVAFWALGVPVEFTALGFAMTSLGAVLSVVCFEGVKESQKKYRAVEVECKKEIERHEAEIAANV